jgi:hypothetical protein
MQLSFMCGRSSPRIHSSPRPRREPFLALCCFLLFRRRSLSDFWLGVLSAFGHSGSSEGQPSLQSLDTLHLVRGCFVRYSGVTRLYDGFIQAFEAAVGVVALLSTVVGLDYDIVGLCSYIAGLSDGAMDSCGDVVQQRVERDSQSSLRIDPLGLLA